MLCIAPSVCDVTHLSVCHGSLSQWLNVSPNFSLSGSHTVLVVPYQMLYQYSNGNSRKGVSNAGDMKNRDFRPVSRSVLRITA